MTAMAVDPRLVASTVRPIPDAVPTESDKDRRLIELVAKVAINEKTLREVEAEATELLTRRAATPAWLQKGLADLLAAYRAWQDAVARDVGRAGLAYAPVCHQALQLADHAAGLPQTPVFAAPTAYVLPTLASGETFSWWG